MLSLVLLGVEGAAAETRPLAERLGHKSTDRILIVNGDDTGMCHAANLATIECLERGIMRTATIMVPCPWFPEVVTYARQNADKDFGVHLTHTAEWSRYRWAPLTAREQAPGLFDPEGYMWHSIEEVYRNATPAEALLEARAQVNRALAAGIDVTHLDSHMGALQLHPDYVKLYLQLAREFDLPVRMASQETFARHGYPELRGQFSREGILFPDFFVYDEIKSEAQDVKSFWVNLVKNLRPGVTELYIHAALPTDELKAITGSWAIRSQEYEVFCKDNDMKRVIEEQRIILMGYKPLRDLQRTERRNTTRK